MPPAASKGAFILTFLFVCGLHFCQTAPADDDDGLLHKLDLKVQAEFDGVINNIRDKLKEHLDSIHGGTCITDDQCSPISYCSKSSNPALFGSCQFVWWFIVLVVALVLALISSVCSCICCPCCFLYSCCQSIWKCFC